MNGFDGTDRFRSMRVGFVSTRIAGSDGVSLEIDKWAQVAERRGISANGRRQYTLQDVYQQSDLVAYPSEYEGFGNAFLEAVYCRRPIICKRYPIYRTDIEPYGFRTVAFDDYITDTTLREAERVLTDSDYRKNMTEHNYRVARQNFSFEVLEEELRPILRRTFIPNWYS